MKKTFVSIIIALLLLIVLVSTTFAAPTAGERQLLLKGSLQETETHEGLPPTIFVEATGSGNATQLGLFTMSFQAELSVPPLPQLCLLNMWQPMEIASSLKDGVKVLLLKLPAWFRSWKRTPSQVAQAGLPAQLAA